MYSTILLITPSIESSPSTGYIVGVVIALFLLGYLIYSLIKPEKF